MTQFILQHKLYDEYVNSEHENTANVTFLISENNLAVTSSYLKVVFSICFILFLYKAPTIPFFFFTTRKIEPSNQNFLTTQPSPFPRHRKLSKNCCNSSVSYPVLSRFVVQRKYWSIFRN